MAETETSKLSDAELRKCLKQIDEDDAIDVTSWEADFIEHVVYKYGGALSDKQRASASKIIDRYLNEDETQYEQPDYSGD